MPRRTTRILFAVLVFCVLPAGPLAGQPAAEQVLAAWNFSTGATFGWTAPGVADLRFADGVLHGRAVSVWPPILSPLIDIHPGGFTRVEIRMRVNKGGPARFYFAPKGSGSSPVFDYNRGVEFLLYPDGEYHDYVLLPSWPAEPSVRQIRISVPNFVTFDIASVRIVNLASSGEAVAPRWEFEDGGGLSGWRVLEPNVPATVAGGVLSVSGPATLLAPRFQLQAYTTEWLSFRLKSTSSWAAEAWHLASRCGGSRYAREIPLISDGKFHVYNVNLGGSGCWWGNPEFFGLKLPMQGNYELDWIRLGDKPDGPAELQIDRLGPVKAINRRGQPIEMSCRILNRGGVPVTGVRAHLFTPDGVEILQEPIEVGVVEPSDPVPLKWTVSADRSGPFRITVLVESDWIISASASVTFPITEPPALTAAEYVPEPQPPANPYEVGVFYYPGWWKGSGNWAPMPDFPERTPALGYYKEGDPMVADWHIKWAADHGIKFFAVDWYWRNGKEDSRHLLQMPALMNARYRSSIKFCLLSVIADEFPLQSVDDWYNMVRYWLDHYLLSEQYYRVDGKPLVIIYDPGWLRNFFGGSAATRSALEKARAMARERGLAGIQFFGGTNGAAEPEEVRRMRDEGYDAATAYTYPRAGADNDIRAPYSAMVDAFINTWDAYRSLGILDYVLPVTAGWDSRPKQGPNALARPGNTPEEFRRMLIQARNRLDPGGPARRRMVIVQAWNELTEGSILEPIAQYGFAPLDAVRDVFAPGAGPHEDVAPSDVGLPLIEWEQLQPAWTFDSPSAFDGWWGNDFTGLAVREGVLSGVTSGSDPSVVSLFFRASARQYSKVAVTMSISRDSTAEFYWESEEAPGMSANRRISFIATTGGMKTYEIPIGSHASWKGTIRRIRLDPTTSAGVTIEIAGIALVP